MRRDSARPTGDAGDAAARYVPEEVPWPPTSPAIAQQVALALADGTWGRYDGRATEELIDRLASMFAGRFVYPCCSGTLAVELALRAVGVTAGDEVILAGYDFPGNFRAVEAIGAMPVLVDLEPDSWSIGADELVAASSDRTRAVLASHLHGTFAPVDRIAPWCHARDIALVEDVCQCPGASTAGRAVGTWGDAAALSFGGSKLLTAGRGGAVVLRDARALQRLKVYGERGNLAFPMSQLQASVLLPQIEDLCDWRERRRFGAERLARGLSQARVLRTLVRPQAGFDTYKFALSIPGGEAMRDRAVQLLQQSGIPCGAGFTGFVKRSSRRCRRVGELPEARRAAESTVLLPHTLLAVAADAIDRLVRALLEADRRLADTNPDD